MARPTQLKNGKFRVKWMSHDGHRLSKVLDTKTEANDYLKERQVESKKIRNGFMMPPQPIINFFQLCDHWVKYKAAVKRSGKHDISIIEFHLKPILGNIEISKIKPSHGDQIKLRLKDRSDKTVHNILTLLNSLLNCAFSEGWLLRSVKVSKPKISVIEKEYRYFKTKDELTAFLQSTMKCLGQDAFDLYSFATHIGMRAGEIGHLKFSDLDFDQELIHVTGSWGGPTKSGEARVIPMLPAVKSILLKRKNNKISDYVFCNHVGNPLLPSDRVFQEKLQKVLDFAGFSKLKIKGKDKHYINFHGMRHTFASHWMMGGLCPFQLQKILGHKDAKTTSRYSHLDVSVYKDSKIRAMNAIPAFYDERVVKFDFENVRKAAQKNDIKYKTPSSEKKVQEYRDGTTA